MHVKRMICVAAAAAGVNATAATIATANASAATITGAGSTLVQPLEARWATGFEHATGDHVEYNAVGSGKGIIDITEREVDFGASDAPMTSSEASACNDCYQIPWGLSATGIGYHIGHLKDGLKLTGKILAEIYLGKITNWDSSAIKALNKGTKLPDLKITPVYRSDGSGDTYAFTHFLADVDGRQWGSHNYATTVGFHASNSVGEDGNAGVAAAVNSTNGAIGYISASYLEGEGISTAEVENAAGKFEYPNYDEIKDAASQVKRATPGKPVSIVDPSRKYKTAYPISTFTDAIVPAHPKNNTAVLKAWLKYCVTTGAGDGEGILFVHIPKVIQTADLKAIGRV